MLNQPSNVPGVVLQPQSSTVINPPPMIQQEFLKWLNTPEDLFRWIEHNLKGEVLKGTDKDGNDVWEYKEQYRQMNDYGVQAVIKQLRWSVNKFNLHADYEDEEINKIVLSIAMNFRLWLATKWRSFGVDPADYYSGVLEEGIINMIYSAYKMSGMKNFYRGILSIQNPGQPVEMPKKKILGIFPNPF